MIDLPRVAVGVDDGDHRNPELTGFVDRNGLTVRVDHENRIRKPVHMLDSAQILLEPSPFLLEAGNLFLRQFVEAALGGHRVQLSQPRDALLDGDEISEESTQPALVDIKHFGAGGLFCHDLLSLAFGAYEQDGLAFGAELGGELEGFSKELERLLKIDDIDSVSFPEDELFHLRVPPLGLVAEVDPRLQQLFHCYRSRRQEDPPPNAWNTGTACGHPAGHTSCVP